MRAADHLVDLGPGAGEHGGRIVAQGTATQVEARRGVADRPVPLGRADGRAARAQAHAERLRGDPRREPAQPARHRRARPARRAHVRDRRVGLGQVDARQRRALQGRRQPPASGAQAAGRAPRDPRARAARQDHRGRPVADRAHAALEPGDVHGPVRRDPRPLLQDPGGARARLQAGPLQLQRQGRALRGVPRRRADQDRDALPARRVRAVRAVPRQALQPRDARGALQGQEHRRRARHAGRGGAVVLRAHPQGAPAPGDARRGGARLRAPRPARDDALRRRGPAREARDRALEDRDRAGRCTSSTSPRRACTSPTCSGCSRCCSGSSTRATAWS